MQARSVLYSRQARTRQRPPRARRLNATRREWFTQPAAIDPPLRDLVLRKFMSMNEAHDRIRMELLAAHEQSDKSR